MKKDINNKKVSIIIPAYNAEHFIERGINSVLNQTYKNIELIIVDDGSNDNTTKLIIDKFGNNNIIKIFRQKNSGVSVARNNGLNKATGDYCIFLDADDWLEETSIEILLNYNKQNSNFFIICDRYFCKINNKKIIKQDMRKIFYDTKIDTQNAIINFMKFNLQSSCYKLFDLNLIKRNSIKFPEGISHGEDGLFVFRYLQYVKNIFYLSKCLWNIYENPHSNTHLKFNEKMLTGIKAARLMIEENNKYNINEVNEALKHYYFYRLSNYSNDFLISDSNNNLYKSFFIKELKKCLKDSLKKHIFGKNEIKAFCFIFFPKFLCLFLLLRKLIKNYKTNNLILGII